MIRRPLKFQRPIVLTGHEAAIYALAPWRGGVLSGGGDGLLAHWTSPFGGDGRVVAQIEDKIICILPLAGAQEGEIVVGTLSGDLYWIDTSSKLLPRRWAFHKDGCFGLCLANGCLFAVGGEGSISAWHLASGSFIKARAVDIVRLRSVAYLPSVQQLVIGSAAGDLHFVDPLTLDTVQVRERAHDATVFSLVATADVLFSAGRDGAIRAWQVASPHAQLTFASAHSATVNALALHPEGYLASAGRDRELRVWNFNDPASAKTQAASASANEHDDPAFAKTQAGSTPSNEHDDPASAKTQAASAFANEQDDPAFAKTQAGSTSSNEHDDPASAKTQAGSNAANENVKPAFADAQADRPLSNPGPLFLEHVSSKLQLDEVKDETGSSSTSPGLVLVLAKALTTQRDGGHTHSVNTCCWIGDVLVSAGDDRTIRIWPLVK